MLRYSNLPTDDFTHEGQLYCHNSPLFEFLYEIRCKCTMYLENDCINYKQIYKIYKSIYIYKQNKHKQTSNGWLKSVENHIETLKYCSYEKTTTCISSA